jgi:hypothetical protein
MSRNVWCAQYDECLDHACVTGERFSCAGFANEFDEGGRGSSDFSKELLLALCVLHPKTMKHFQQYKKTGGPNNWRKLNRAIERLRAKCRNGETDVLRGEFPKKQSDGRWRPL